MSNSGLSEVPVHISIQQLLSRFCGYKILFKCTVRVSILRRVDREMGNWGGGEGKQSGILLCGHHVWTAAVPSGCPWPDPTGAPQDCSFPDLPTQAVLFKSPLVFPGFVPGVLLYLWHITFIHFHPLACALVWEKNLHLAVCVFIPLFKKWFADC